MNDICVRPNAASDPSRELKGITDHYRPHAGRLSRRARDSFQPLVDTAAKLDVRLYHYFRDRLLHPDTTPSLAELIRAWSAPAPLNPS